MFLLCMKLQENVNVVISLSASKLSLVQYVFGQAVFVVNPPWQVKQTLVGSIRVKQLPMNLKLILSVLFST